MKRFSIVLLLLALVLGVFGAMAQDATPTVDPAMIPAETTEADMTGDMHMDGNIDLGELTGNTDAYYGQTVTVEGTVDDLLNVRAFVLGGSGLLSNPQVLVINNSGEEFDVRLTEGARFRVTGVVYPSFADGGLTQVVANMNTAEQPMAEATAEAGPNMDYTTNLASMIVPDNLFNHTILVISQIQDVALLALPE